MADFKHISELIEEVLKETEDFSMNFKNKEKKKMEQTNNKWLEGLEKGGLLYLYLVSLISSDSLFTVEDCEESLKKIDYCLEILPENDIKDKDKIHDMLLQGREIVLRDMERIKNEN